MFDWKSVFAALALLLVASGPGLSQDEDYNPWEHVKVGDWAKYSAKPGPGMESQTKQVVTKIEAGKVTCEMTVQMVKKGKPVGTPFKSVQTIDLATEAKGSYGKPKEVESGVKVRVKKKKLTCDVMETVKVIDEQTQEVTRTWICKDVPFGTVKIQVDGKSTLELIDWGPKKKKKKKKKK